MSAPRLHVPGLPDEGTLELPEDAAHHARDVLRLRAGASIRLFDGRGHERAASVQRLDRRAVVVELAEPLPSRPESPLRLVLAVSPLKSDLLEDVIRRATELGVAEVWPVVTARTDTVARPALSGSRQERWQRVAVGAAEQCGRAVVPHIAPARSLVELLGAPFAGLRAALLEAGAERPLAALPRPASALLLVGPAGGLAPDEVESLRAAGFATAALGPRILRAETAAVAAVAAAQLLWGDLSA